MSDHHHRSPSCFRPSSTATANPNLTTCLYNTELGLFALSWSSSGHFTRSLHLLHHHYSDQLSDTSFHLKINQFPWIHSSKKGSKKLNLLSIINNSSISIPARIYWDLSGAKYGSGPEPISGFHIAIAVENEIILLVGDSDPKKSPQLKKINIQDSSNSPMVLKREHIYGTKIYSTKAQIGGNEKTLTIECQLGTDPKLCFSINGKLGLEIKHLKWKFRGNESIEIDGTIVQISWDVYNWLFDSSTEKRNRKDGYALFMFTIFDQKSDEQQQQQLQRNSNNNSLWSQSHQYQHHHQQQSSFGFGFDLEEKRMKRKKKNGPGGLLKMRSGRSSSSSSLSSANSCSSCNSSVMEWANSEDDEQYTRSFPYSAGFSLLVYAWN